MKSNSRTIAILYVFFKSCFWIMLIGMLFSIFITIYITYFSNNVKAISQVDSWRFIIQLSESINYYYSIPHSTLQNIELVTEHAEEMLGLGIFVNVILKQIIFVYVIYCISDVVKRMKTPPFKEFTKNLGKKMRIVSVSIFLYSILSVAVLSYFLHIFMEITYINLSGINYKGLIFSCFIYLLSLIFDQGYFLQEEYD